MIASVLMNSIMQFAYILCLLFTIGDVDKVANTPTLLPIIEVYYEATGSKHATNLFVVMLAIIILIAFFNVFASVSRLVWAFSRDKGLPFSSFFGAVSRTFARPLKFLVERLLILPRYRSTPPLKCRSMRWGSSELASFSSPSSTSVHQLPSTPSYRSPHSLSTYPTSFRSSSSS